MRNRESNQVQRSLLLFLFLTRSVTPNAPRAPEILFKPELIGRDHCGIHESLFKSILGSDIDLRRSLLQNIVLSGNGSFLCTVVTAAQVYTGPAVMGGRSQPVHRFITTSLYLISMSYRWKHLTVWVTRATPGGDPGPAAP